VWCSVLQCATACYSVPQHAAVQCKGRLQCVATATRQHKCGHIILLLTSEEQEESQEEWQRLARERGTKDEEEEEEDEEKSIV